MQEKNFNMKFVRTLTSFQFPNLHTIQPWSLRHNYDLFSGKLKRLVHMVEISEAVWSLVCLCYEALCLAFTKFSDKIFTPRSVRM